ncbi:MAG TPA: DUF2490 domain-containing protein [Candidatus Angelobacter sp.]|jgi:hypothetical protein|nr:DUF2490 domain-containing protein [Candidatus Angelobacter sp.]
MRGAIILGLWFFLLLALSPAAAQTSQFLPEIDAYYTLTPVVRVWMQAKETDEAGAPVTAEFGPSLDFYLKPLPLLSDITTNDNDASKSRPIVLSIGYRYLPYPGAPPTNRMEPVLTLNAPLPGVKILFSDRNRFDLDWNNGAFHWRYRNRPQFQRTFGLGSYHISPYVSAEFYYESQYSKWADTALYAGCYFPLGRHFQLNPYYEHQNQTGKSPNQQYNQFGLMLNIFYDRK